MREMKSLQENLCNCHGKITFHSLIKATHIGKFIYSLLACPAMFLVSPNHAPHDVGLVNEGYTNHF